MLGKTWRIGAIALVAVLLIGAVVPAAIAAPLARNRETVGQAPGLSPSEIEALGLALDDEYKEWATYDQVLADLGTIAPFSRIVVAEQIHIDALVTLLNRYGLEVPPNPWPGNVPSFDTRPEACAAGVEAEIANAALYDQLLGMVSHRDIIRVFTALQQASLTKHLPAFERCAP
jgi:hypothetical protein